jgi:hypothetical protein
VCADEGIPVHLRPPLLSEVDTWEGAFISSTSRLLLPLHELVYPAPPQHTPGAGTAPPQQQQQQQQEQQLTKVGDNTCPVLGQGCAAVWVGTPAAWALDAAAALLLCCTHTAQQVLLSLRGLCLTQVGSALHAVFVLMCQRHNMQP